MASPDTIPVLIAVPLAVFLTLTYLLMLRREKQNR